VGGTRTIPVNVRIVTGTKRDLKQMVAEGKFREDLYYRLNVFPIHLPALRERVEDIPRLVEHFLIRFGRNSGKAIRGISADAVAALQGYPWPGNVRELENAIERAMIVARSHEIQAADLELFRRASTAPTNSSPAPVVSLATPPLGQPSARPLSARLLDEEKREIMAAIERLGGNIAGAARQLGINRSTLYYRLRKHGLEHLLPTKVSGPGEEAGET